MKRINKPLAFLSILFFSGCTCCRFADTYSFRQAKHDNKLYIGIKTFPRLFRKSLVVGNPPSLIMGWGFSDFNSDRLNRDRNISDVYIIYENGNDINMLSLPGPIKANLIQYLNIETNLSSSFDCYKFVCFLYALDPNSLEETFWHSYKTESSLHPGDIIGIFNNKNLDKSLHFAIYLGNSLYLSKFGLSPVRITSLEKMLIFYPGYTFFATKITGKKKKVLYAR